MTTIKGYFEAFFEQPPPFKLSLIETTTEETVWSGTIREGTSALSLALKRFFLDLQVKKSQSKIFHMYSFYVYGSADNNRKHFQMYF